jgi:hypothetical protein
MKKPLLLLVMLFMRNAISCFVRRISPQRPVTRQRYGMKHKSAAPELIDLTGVYNVDGKFSREGVGVF